MCKEYDFLIQPYDNIAAGTKPAQAVRIVYDVRNLCAPSRLLVLQHQSVRDVKKQRARASACVFGEKLNSDWIDNIAVI